MDPRLHSLESGLIVSSEVGGGESDQEILMVPRCVILSLGVWSSISGPGPAVGLCPWVAACLCFA